MKRLKIVVLVILLSAMGAFSFAAQKKRIVILDFQNLTAFNSYDFLGTQFQKIYNDSLNNSFDILPKSQYAQLVSEITAISPNYLFDRNIGIQICRVLNLHAVIMGRYNCSSSQAGDISRISLELMLIMDFGNKVEILRESADCSKETLMRSVSSVSSLINAKLIKLLQR